MDIKISLRNTADWSFDVKHFVSGLADFFPLQLTIFPCGSSNSKGACLPILVWWCAWFFFYRQYLCSEARAQEPSSHLAYLTYSTTDPAKRHGNPAILPASTDESFRRWTFHIFFYRKVKDLMLETATKNHPEPGFGRSWRGFFKEGIATVKAIKKAIKKTNYHWEW